MSVAQAPQVLGRGIASPLMSNNPFRNKVAPLQPPAPTTPATPPVQSSRPVSTNPFLDSSEFSMNSMNTVKKIPSEGINGAAEIFASMSMNGKPPSPERRPRPTANRTHERPEKAAAYRLKAGASSHYRPTTSDESRRHQGGSLRRADELDIFADPPDVAVARERRPTRRNSESSVRDKVSLFDPEEERKQKDRRSRDPRPGKYKPSRKMDIIDKLDVTSIYGAGLFHHDGPFDACNPNRNKKRHKFAPMQAFPKDSANMQMGGSGPLNTKMDYNKFHGIGQEAHIDFNEAAVVDDDIESLRRPLPSRSASFNPTAPDTVHGQETVGLGTSTFLEGAPASKLAIERRDSELNDTQQPPFGGPGLSRKKSLAQKLRGARTGSNRVQSPDSDRAPTSPLATGRSENSNNPFFKDYDREYEKKGQQIAQAEELGAGRARALSSPRLHPTLERQITGDNSESPTDMKSGGFLGRMRSMKKTKPRVERREAS